ncbi:uncharacterized protein LOC142588270 [Dermacentor variabilis]|uniref:uncharacterized protein LOC142588270 n=1 Tax=Dermacentor variabilis TaxID=34621 RepID=UPI003F5B3FEA
MAIELRSSPCYYLFLTAYHTLFPGLPQQSLRLSTLALIAGFLVRAVQDNIDCLGCIDKLRAPTCTSTTTALIAGIDRGGLSYPTLAFVGFVSLLEGATSKAAAVLVKGPQPLKKFGEVVLPSIVKNPLFMCSTNHSEAHRMELVRLVLKKFMRPFLTNFAGLLTEGNAKRNALNRKPNCRKVLEV